MANNTNSNYNTFFNRELTELDARLKRRQALKQELEALNLEISKRREGVIGLAALANVDLGQSHPDLSRGEFEAAIGLTKAICKLFDEIDRMSGYSATCIRDELEDMGFPAKAYRNSRLHYQRAQPNGRRGEIGTRDGPRHKQDSVYVGRWNRSALP